MADRSTTVTSNTPVTHEWSIRADLDGKELAPGTLLGQFRVEARIGRGGRGVVYRAYDVKLERFVALKVLAGAPSSPEAEARLLEEARAAAALTHPAIAAIHDVQRHEHVIFIVMELVAGTTLRARLTPGPLAIDVALRHARDIAAGLARAHRSKIVHRDLKPENVMVTPEGDAKILDFGLAREARQAPESAPPSSGGAEASATAVVGTPDYMAPEQARGKKVDTRADVFSFGVVLHEMLTGKRPFERKRGASPSDAESWSWAPIEAIPPVLAVAPELPAELARVVDRCLALDPSTRFADGGELLDALRGVEVSGSRSPPRPPGGLALWAGAGALGVAVVVSFVVSPTPPPARTEAPAAAAAETSPSPALTSAPVQLTHEGLCSGTPIFADDGSIVYSREEPGRVELYRRDPQTGAERALTNEGGFSTRPQPGAPGEVVYRFTRPGKERGMEMRSVPLAGGPPHTLSPGNEPVVAGDTLFFLQTDSRAIRSRPLGEGPEQVVFDAPPSSRFTGLAASEDGRWLSIGQGDLSWMFATPVCIGDVDPRGSLDCKSAGIMTSRRATFAPGGRGLYFARGKSLVRFDLATHATAAVALPAAVSNLAIAPDGASIVYSTCKLAYQGLRLGGETPTPVTGLTDAMGQIAVGPSGQIGFVVANDAVAALGVTDGAGGPVRVLTGADARVTESLFSPDGKRLLFHDVTPATGGLFAVDADGMSVPTRITSDPRDTIAAWTDADHVVFTRSEHGFPNGRPYVTATTGGEPRALAKLPGIVIGAVPSRGTVLLVIGDSAGDRFAEATLDGRVHDIPLRGWPKGLHWDVTIAASASGRYVTWFAGGEPWEADMQQGVATRVQVTPPGGRPVYLQADDTGRVTVVYQHSEGQLYRMAGRFP